MFVIFNYFITSIIITNLKIFDPLGKRVIDEDYVIDFGNIKIAVAYELN